MSAHHPQSAKIMQHAEGLGAPNADQVRRRALELAFLDGRGDFNEQDWHEAKRELHGGHGHTNSEDEAEMVALVSAHDMVVTDLGHHVQNIGLEDADNVVEELIAEGMDEAVHEQMLAARHEDEDKDADEKEDDE
ncbi:MAG: hypothetical protein ABIZ56_05090 [Chthoniobacteraceae bacterium]